MEERKNCWRVADKTGSTGDSGGLHPLMIHVPFGQTSSMKGQNKIGVTYIIMNNEFYGKYLAWKLSQSSMRKALCFMSSRSNFGFVRAELADRTDFIQKVNVIVGLIRLKGDSSQPILVP